MADFKPMGLDRALFQLQTSGADRSAAAPLRDTDLEKASHQFESLLLNFMIREMRETIPESGLFPRSMAEDIYTSMFDEKIAGVMADSGGIGISRMLIEQLNDGEKDQ